MKRKWFRYGICLGALLLTAVILSFPSQCLSLSLQGLQLWFTKMIPALFPFMVLSGIIIRMDLISLFVRPLTPLLGKLYQVRPPLVYGMVIGFLCGFPMGAHTAAELYRTQKISKEEASFLLAFCNNIGPVYFLSFALPTIGIRRRLLPFGIMYLLPLIYGLVLRYSRYRQLPSYSDSGQENSPSASPACFLLSLEAAIDQSLQNITKLGGYMILFNLLFILPQLAVSHMPLPVSRQNTLFACLCCLLEITGGISLCGSKLPLFVLTILPFGGLSCIAQTGSMLGGTDLSLTEYVKHKLILTAFTFFFYVLAAFLSWLP